MKRVQAKINSMAQEAKATKKAGYVVLWFDALLVWASVNYIMPHLHTVQERLGIVALIFYLMVVAIVVVQKGENRTQEVKYLSVAKDFVERLYFGGDEEEHY